MPLPLIAHSLGKRFFFCVGLLLCIYFGSVSRHAKYQLNKLTDEAERAGLQRITRLSEGKEWEKRKACQSGLRGEDREPKPSTADHDSLGHYVLLLACCDSEKRSLWLSHRESLLCERFIRQQFPFPSREAAQLAIIDYGAQDWLRPCSVDDRDYFSCDWRRVLKLVEGRNVVVRSGIAWLHADHVPYALAEDHCSRLRHCLGWLRRIKPSLTVRYVGEAVTIAVTVLWLWFQRPVAKLLLNHHLSFFSLIPFISRKVECNKPAHAQSRPKHRFDVVDGPGKIMFVNSGDIEDYISPLFSE